MATRKPRITITFDPEIYSQIKKIAHQENKEIAVVTRELVDKALNIDLCSANLDFVCTIIREQIKALLPAYMNRIIALESKSCIQASTAAYLCAETLNRFVPEGKREDFVTVYEKARKKAVKYLKSDVESE